MAAIFKMAVNEIFLKIIKNTIKMRVFYPTGVREGIYCDLLAITTLNLVIIIIIIIPDSDFSKLLPENRSRRTKTNLIQK